MERRWISVREASEYLSIHFKSCYRLIDRGEIPAAKIGGNVSVDLKWLREILEEREICTVGIGGK